MAPDAERSQEASSPALRTVTFLCTDIEGSTQLWEQHPDAMRASLARHDAILGEAVACHGGSIFKTTGDGAYAVLETPTDAIGAAVAAMRALDAEPWGETGPLTVRMGIGTGEVEQRDGDYFGLALNRTSRLMSAAHGGQVVVAGATADLLGDDLPPDVELVDLGFHRLRGIERPEQVHQLVAAGLRTEFPPLQSIDAFASLPEVRPSFARVTDELSGRSEELERLEDAWSRASRGGRRVVLVAGDAGIGKTRLIGELANLVVAQDGAVLYGRCDEDTVVPYQPFVEALQPYVAAYPPAVLHERLHGLEQELTRLFPDLAGRVRAAPYSDDVGDHEAARYRLFEAITSLVTGVAAAGPAVLVLDDLHWADRPTLLLLRHVVRATAESPLLIVVCYRDVEVLDDHAAADLLLDLRREPYTELVALGGLSETEAAALLATVAGHEVATALARALHREAGGNPFFLVELFRSLLDTNGNLASVDATPNVEIGELKLPQTVRDVVTRRVRRLPEPVPDVLAVASVVGPEFDATLLARAGDWSPEIVLDALERASNAGVVDARTGHIGAYAFAHDLVRQALYADLSAAQKAQLHARVGTALEEQPTAPLASVLAEHFSQALVLGTAPKALEYTIAAAREAALHLAFEDAAAIYGTALNLLEQYAPDDTGRRLEVLIEGAEVLTFVDESAGVAAATQAVDETRAHGTAEQFGRAVAVFAEPVAAVMASPERVEALLHEAQQALGEEHPALRARLMAVEAFKYAAYQLPGRDARPLAAETVTLARATGDVPTLTAALFARATSLESTPQMVEREALGRELVELGRAGGGRAAMATTQGLRVLAGVHLELGDAESLADTITELGRTGQEQRWLPALVYEAQWRATCALLSGRFDDVRGHWADMRQYARAYRAVGGIQAAQTYFLAREQGDLAGLVGLLESVASDAAGSRYLSALLAVAQLERGSTAEARATLESIDPEKLRHDEHEAARGAALALLAEVAASVGAREHTEVLAELLVPYSGRLIMAMIGLACLGAADRYRGMLSTALGCWDDAEAQLDQAVALEQRAGGTALAVRTRSWQAQLLLARGQPGDHDAANAMLDRVEQDARGLGMRGLAAQAEQLRSA